MVARVFSGAASGAVIGIFVSVVAVVSTIAASFLTESTVEIPYLIVSSYSEIDGGPALYFTPDRTGMVGAVVIAGAAVAVSTLVVDRRNRRRSISG